MDYKKEIDLFYKWYNEEVDEDFDQKLNEKNLQFDGLKFSKRGYNIIRMKKILKKMKRK